MYEDLHLRNKAFSARTPGLQLAVDSTSLGELKICPRRYQLSILEGYQPRQQSVHLTFGLAYHSALEHYDHARARGASHKEGMIAAARQALRLTWDKELKRPWISTDSHKNRATLLRSVLWYLDNFENDPLETLILANGKPAVELSFKLPLPYRTKEGEQFVLCGHLDKVARMSNFLYIVDKKTTAHGLDARYFNQFTPDNQMSLYIIAGKLVFDLPISGLLIDAAQVLVEGTRFQRQPIYRSPGELEEWMLDLSSYLEMAEIYAEQGHWPMNDKVCGLYGGCPFRQICSMPPSLREAQLKVGFDKRTWDPTVARGDI